MINFSSTTLDHIPRVSYGNGSFLTNVSSTSQTTSGTDAGFDSNGRSVRHIWKKGSPAAEFARFENSYNATNRRTSEYRGHTRNTGTYTFDSAYRMLEFLRNGSINSTRVLDGADKMAAFLDEGVNQSPVVDGYPAEAGLNQYSSFAGLARTYNDNGGLAHPDGPAGSLYRYDAANRLMAVQDSLGNVLAKYCYDAMGRRILSFTVSSGTRRYVYSRWRMLEEQNGAGATLIQFVDGDGIDEHLQMTIPSASMTFYYHCNSQGFVGLLTDGAGAVVETYEYEWLGAPVGGASVVGNPYMWQGRRYEPLTKLYYFRNRYYDNQTGEFLTIDPSGLWTHGQGNGYDAFAGDGWNQRDPLGLDVQFSNAKRGKEMLPYLQRMCPCYELTLAPIAGTRRYRLVMGKKKLPFITRFSLTPEGCEVEYGYCTDFYNQSCGLLRFLVDSERAITISRSGGVNQLTIRGRVY